MRLLIAILIWLQIIIVTWNSKNLSLFSSNRIVVESRTSNKGIIEGEIVEILKIKEMELNKIKIDENACSTRQILNFHEIVRFVKFNIQFERNQNRGWKSLFQTLLQFARETIK